MFSESQLHTHGSHMAAKHSVPAIGVVMPESGSPVSHVFAVGDHVIVNNDEDFLHRNRIIRVESSVSMFGMNGYIREIIPRDMIADLGYCVWIPPSALHLAQDVDELPDPLDRCERHPCASEQIRIARLLNDGDSKQEVDQFSSHAGSSAGGGEPKKGWRVCTVCGVHERLQNMSEEGCLRATGTQCVFGNEVSYNFGKSINFKQ